MTREPNFDDLFDPDELDAGERARFARVHDLLVSAGPPPELSPELEAAPDMLAAYRSERKARSRFRNRGALLLAAALIAIAAFVAGSHRGDNGFDAIRTVQMQPTGVATGASAKIEIGREWHENWPMRISASGLPASKGTQYYAVFLTRNGKIVGPCGWFVARTGRALADLNAPYNLKGAGWIVTSQHRGDKQLGQIVLRTAV